MIVICPNCQNYVEILELNCCIFRHAVYKESNPSIIDKLIKDNLILGCGKPFKIINCIAIPCDYI